MLRPPRSAFGTGIPAVCPYGWPRSVSQDPSERVLHHTLAKPSLRPPRLLPPVRLALFLLAVAVALAAWLVARRPAVAWSAVEAEVTRRDPGGATVSPAALAERLEAGADVVLLDAREPAEYAVSHLAGARHIDPDASAADLAAALADTDRQREVVVYCAVGVRSATVARRLRAAGFRRVANLDGSIFRWANEGRPVVRDGRQVREVHPYSAAWGRLLDPERRADVE